MLCYFNNDNWGILHTGTIHFGYCENCLKILKKITWNVLNVELLLKQLWKSINLYSVNHFAFWIFQKKLPMKKFVKNMWNIYILSASNINVLNQGLCQLCRHLPCPETLAPEMITFLYPLSLREKSLISFFLIQNTFGFF